MVMIEGECDHGAVPSIACSLGMYGSIQKINALALMLCGIAGLKMLLFAMWFDMESNRDLR